VSPLGPGNDRAKKIDLALRDWRQGDIALGPKWLTYIADGDAPLTEHAESEKGLHAVTVEAPEGVVVVTQTCDIVRPCTARPLVSVAALKRVDADLASEVARGLRPQYVSIATQPTLVADLDLVTTVEKSVVASWERTPGWTRENDLRWFAEALARKDSRFAFPDDFARAIKKLQARIRDKHNRDSEEGAALRALREIRVTATPAWGAENVEVFLAFVRHDTPEAARFRWDDHLERWLGLCEAYGVIRGIEGRVSTLDGLNAREYVESDRLDLDHLSGE
jgi:hypothetical protein